MRIRSVAVFMQVTSSIDVIHIATLKHCHLIDKQTQIHWVSLHEIGNVSGFVPILVMKMELFGTDTTSSHKAS